MKKCKQKGTCQESQESFLEIFTPEDVQSKTSNFSGLRIGLRVDERTSHIGKAMFVKKIPTSVWTRPNSFTLFNGTSVLSSCASFVLLCCALFNPVPHALGRSVRKLFLYTI